MARRIMEFGGSMKARLLTLLSLFLLLAACAPSEAAVREAIEATAAALPTATVEPAMEATATPVAPSLEPTATAEELPTATAKPTSVPLGEIDLGPLLIAEGDLPDNLEGELVEYGATFRFDREDVTPADQLVSQQFYDTEAERPSGASRSTSTRMRRLRARLTGPSRPT
jgi:hypothetical protein